MVFARAEHNIPILPGYEYIWLMDTNHCISPAMDFDRVNGFGGPTPHPLGIQAMRQVLSKFEPMYKFLSISVSTMAWAVLCCVQTDAVQVGSLAPSQSVLL